MFCLCTGSQWRTNNRQTRNPKELGHRKNGSVGMYDKFGDISNSSPIRKSASNADIGYIPPPNSLLWEL
jgi:hypothetical protein